MILEWIKRVGRPGYGRALLMLERGLKRIAHRNRRLHRWLARQDDRQLSIYWEPQGWSENISFQLGKLRRLAAKVGSFENGIIRRVTFCDAQGIRLFSIPIDLTEYTQARYYLRYPDPPLRDLIVAGGQTFVDAGANVGIFSLLASRHFEHVYAFEPLPATFQALHANVRGIANVEALRAAASNRDGRGTIHQNAIGLGGSSLQPFPDADREKTNKDNWQQYPIDTVRLDSMCDRFERVDLLKIDVEGHEVQVIAGALNLIARDQPILYVEIQHQDRFVEVCALLPAGFCILDPYARRLTDQRAPDTVFFWPRSWETIRRVFGIQPPAISIL